MNRPFIGHVLILIVIGTLVACQTPSRGKTSSFTQFHPPSSLPTHRACWRRLSPTLSGSPRTFILATAANVGELQLTHRDAQEFVRAMQARYRLPNENICLLTEVYRAEFEQALRDLARRVNPSDRVVVFFSGHGSYIKDDNGDEDDQLDDVLVPLDVKDLEMPRREDVIVDDQLAQLVNALPTSNVLTFIDACYAGGMYMGRAWTRGQPRLKFFAKGEVGTLSRPLQASHGRRGTPLQGVMFAAAQEYQKAWEDPNQGGVFTTCFLQTLQQAPGANLLQLFQSTVNNMPTCNRVNEIQSPKIEGNINLATHN